MCIAQLEDTDHTRAVWQVGPGAISVFVVANEGHFLVLC